MKIIRLLLPLSWLLLAAASASAANSFTVEVDPTKPQADACNSTAVAAAADAKADRVTVTLKAKHKANLTISVDGKPVTLKAGELSIKLADGNYTDKTLKVDEKGKIVCHIILAPPIAPAVDPPKADPPKTDPPKADPPKTDPPASPELPTVDRAELAVLEQQARAFLAAKNIAEHQIVKQSNFGRTFRLYHLPTGAPAFPLPRHVNEKDDVEIWTVVPADATVSVDVSACDKIPAVRVAGTYKASKEAIGAFGVLQSAEDEVPFKLDAFARRLSCAGTLTYKIDVTRAGLAASTTTSLAFDPVYRFEWGLGFMFDFGRPKKLSLGDRPTVDAMATEKFVIESDDYSGATPVITLGVNLCGTNPAEMTWCDRLANPTLIVDPTRLTSGFGVGLTVRPFHGIGLLAGVTVYETTVFADGANASVGDTWTAPGELPTKQVFNKDSVGFVLGVVMSTDVFAAIKGAAE